MHPAGRRSVLELTGSHPPSKAMRTGDGGVIALEPNGGAQTPLLPPHLYSVNMKGNLPLSASDLMVLDLFLDSKCPCLLS